ncbi:MAG: ABC transporter substrate-binding protein [Caldimonas sp.]
MTIRFLLAFVLAFAAPAATSQVVQQMPRIGALYMGGPTSTEGPSGGFERGMRELGYVPGRNVVIEYRYAEGRPDRLAALASELVAAKVDAVIAGGPGPLEALRLASRKVPIVAVSGSDPVAEGWAASLARPGGNVTGLQVTYPELSAKRLELLKEMLPGLVRVAMLIAGFELPDGGASAIRSMEEAARRTGIQLQVIPVGSAADIERAMRAAAAARAQAIFTQDTAFLVVNRALVTGLAARQGVPVSSEFSAFGVEGVLMTYGADLNDLLRRAATYVDRVLKGARAGELPIERPDKLDLTINLKVARALGVAVPQSLLLRAARVVE